MVDGSAMEPGLYLTVNRQGWVRSHWSVAGGRVCPSDSGEPIPLSVCTCRVSVYTIFSRAESPTAGARRQLAVHLCLGFSETNRLVNS